MWMLIKIAWRNIWRSKLRSGTLVTSIALGLLAGIFATAIGNGANKGRLEDTIKSQLSHIQIHQEGFRENLDVKRIITNLDEVRSKVEASNATSISSRTIVNGMVSSVRNTAAVQIKGIEPDNETKVTGLSEKMVEGDFLNEEKSGRIIIGKALSEKLKTKMRKRIEFRFTKPDGEIGSAAYKIAGIYKTNNTREDEMSVYILKSDLDQILGISNGAHEIAILYDDIEIVDSTALSLAQSIPELKVESWKQLFPGLAEVDIIQERSNLLILLIILLALSFGIVNTMLMSVLERIKEFGMLMAVGMNKRKVFSMIMLETTFIMAIAAPIGMLVSYILVKYFEKNGIDFSASAEGLESVGMSPIIYPHLDPSFYWQVVVLVLIASFLAAIYPARRAIKLNPADAIRKI